MLKKLAVISILAAAMALARSVNANAAERAESAQPAAHAAAEGQSGEAEHKPSLVPSPFSRETWYSALWVVVIFVILLIILYPAAWKSVLEGLKKREERIRKDIADAEATRAKAEATLKQYQAQLATAEDKVRELIASATIQGEKIATEIRMKAQQESEETKQRAVREIDNARKQALTDIYQRAAEISTSIASKILRRNINADDQRDLVRQGLSELETASK